jgi:hypothetical protein
MKFSIVALAGLSGLASAQQAIVINSCSSPIYVQSFPYDGSAAGPLTTVQPGKSFSEKFRPSGSVSASSRCKNDIWALPLTDYAFVDYQNGQDANVKLAVIFWLLVLVEPGLRLL